MSLFLGWMPSTDQRAALADLVEQIRRALPTDAPRHSWRKPAQWHMTIRYLGEDVPREEQAQLITALPDALAAVAPFRTGVAALRYWPKAHVLVAELERNDAARHLFEQCEQVCRELGFAADKRVPTPHITLAYLPRDRAQMPLPTLPIPAQTALLVDRVGLLETVPGAYAPRCEWPLQSAGMR